MTADEKEKAIEVAESLSICCCGGVDRWGIIKAMLERAAGGPDWSKGTSFYNPLPEFDLSGQAVEFIAHVMDSDPWSLLEHGTSVGHAWLTQRGKSLLALLRDHGTDPDVWEEDT